MANDLPEWQAYMECCCSSKSHLVSLEYDREWGLTMNFQANQFQGFWKRLWIALKFVCGIRSGYTFWDGVIVRKEDVPKFEEWLDQAKKHGYGDCN